MVNYKNLRPNNLASPEFRHLLLLLYWPIHGIVFYFIERGLTLNYTAVEIPFDRKIPFCEFFIFPYYFWFVFLIGIHLYTLFFDLPALKKLMYFVIITYSLTMLLYLLFPNKQELRPTVFARDNFCVNIVKLLYSYDTNTNVCPSLHVIGSMAVLFTSWQCDRFKTFWWRAFFLITTVLICLSTVFLKQHSIVDVWLALIISFAAYPVAFILPDRRIKQTTAAKEALKAPATKPETGVHVK